MKTNYKLLWLFSDLCDLYGDEGNLNMIKKRLSELGANCEILKPAAEDIPDFRDVDMIYMGPGKAKNVEYAGKCLLPYGDKLIEVIEKGMPTLVCGSSRVLLCKTFENASGEIKNGIGLFNAVARETGNVFVSDVVGRALTKGSPTCYGFINRTAHIDGECETPLFELLYGPGDNEKPAKTEGVLYKNLFATWCIGPILVKNPDLLYDFLERMVGEPLPAFDDEMERKALALTLSEFKL